MKLFSCVTCPFGGPLFLAVYEKNKLNDDCNEYDKLSILYNIESAFPSILFARSAFTSIIKLASITKNFVN